MKIQDTALNVLATMRLIRLVVTDDLGAWLVVDPAQRWADKGGYDWQTNLVSGLDCPHCVGFWLGAGVLAADRLTVGRRGRGLFLAVRATLALSAVTGHVSARID